LSCLQTGCCWRKHSRRLLSKSSCESKQSGCTWTSPAWHARVGNGCRAVLVAPSDCLQMVLALQIGRPCMLFYTVVLESRPCTHPTLPGCKGYTDKSMQGLAGTAAACADGRGLPAGPPCQEARERSARPLLTCLTSAHHVSYPRSRPNAIVRPSEDASARSVHGRVSRRCSDKVRTTQAFSMNFCPIFGPCRPAPTGPCSPLPAGRLCGACRHRGGTHLPVTDLLRAQQQAAAVAAAAAAVAMAAAAAVAAPTQAACRIAAASVRRSCRQRPSG